MKTLVSTLVENGVELSEEGQKTVSDLFATAVLEESSRLTAIEVEKIAVVNEAHRKDLEEKTKQVCRLAINEWHKEQTIVKTKEKLNEGNMSPIQEVYDAFDELETVVKKHSKAIEKSLSDGKVKSKWLTFKESVNSSSLLIEDVYDTLNESTDEVSTLKRALGESVAMNEQLLAKVTELTPQVIELSEAELVLPEETKAAIIALLESDSEIEYDAAVSQVLAEEAKKKEDSEKAEKDAADAEKAKKEEKGDDEKEPVKPKLKTVQEQTLEFIRTGKTSALVTELNT